MKIVSLYSLEGLENVIVVCNLVISDNNSLANLGLEALETVSNDLFIQSNPELCDTLIDNLLDQLIEPVGGLISVADNKLCPAP